MAKYSTLKQIQDDILSGTTSLTQVLDYYFSQIEATSALNIYVETFETEAYIRAKVLEDKYKKSPKSIGKLYGMILSIKDVLCYEGHSVTAGSKILQTFISPFSATAIKHLLAEDAIIIGRVNCDQFAMGSTNENSFYGPTLNADDPTRIPGGSSGASAVSVQADTCLASLGTDTGGSVRQPAAFCGIYGIKPTYGRISRYGLLAYGSSFDQIGTLSHSIEDAALLLEIMSGADDYDSTASERPIEKYSENLNYNKKARIAYIESALHHKGVDSDILHATVDFIEKLKGEGHTVESVDFDLIDYLVPAYYVLTTAEASSNLSRYDGIRYGYRSNEAANFLETYTKSRTEGFSEEVKRRIMLGTFVLSSGYYDAYYTKAQKVRRLISEKTQAIFENYDFILLPTSPIPAWKIGEKNR